ncbi:MAG: transcription elongation factor GreA, partial [Treponema sp.]|nr:transcription elongation factor GreA [Treponema sp.]
MSEALVQSVENMLKEAKWTRSTINNFTVNNLVELGDIVQHARAEHCADTLQSMCDEHLVNNKDSIIALYISGMLSLAKGTLDNSMFISLVDIFEKNHKEALVTHLCETILSEDANNKFAIRTLAGRYRADGNDKAWGLYERLVKLDFEEVDMAKALGEHYEACAAAEADKDKSSKLLKDAIGCYKKALLRSITAKNNNTIRETWTKLVQLVPQEIDFFTLAKRKIEKNISRERAADLMKDLYAWYKDNQQWDTAIDILKQNLNVEPHDSWARKEIIDCYRATYAGRSNVEEYIRQSNLSQSFRNVFEAINDFEKHIAFDVGSYVFHRQWHVGRIKKVENDTLTINFGKKIGRREMSLKMAVQALTPLAHDHIWVLKATMPRAELTKKIKEEKAWALKTIIKSFGNNCDLKRIKNELVSTANPEHSLLKPSEWTTWNAAAKKILASDSAFSVNPNDISQYMVRDHDLTQEEKLSNEFKAQKQFAARIDILMKYIDNDECDKTSEQFNEMLSYFTSYLKGLSKAGEQEVASYLVIQRIGAIDKNLAYPVKFSFAELYRKIEDPR